MNRVTMLCAQSNDRAIVMIRHDLLSDGPRTDRRFPKRSQELERMWSNSHNMASSWKRGSVERGVDAGRPQDFSQMGLYSDRS
jgi:hypothetical protein